MLAGDRLFWPRKVTDAPKKSRLGGIMRSISAFSIKHAKAVIVLTILLAVPAIYLYTQMDQGQDLISMMPQGLESKQAYDMMDQQMGSGNIERTMVVVTLPCNLTDSSGNYTKDALDRIEYISNITASVQGVDKVYSMTRPEGDTIQYDNLSTYKEVEKTYYTTYMDNNTGIDGRTTLVYVAFNGSPYSDEALKGLDTMKENYDSYEKADGNGTVTLIGGTSAMSYDYQKMCSPRFAGVIIVVFIGIFIVFMALLKSIVTPVRMFVSMLMGIIWTLALFTLSFQFGMHASIIWILPIILFCTLMGLGGDYVVFMMSRVREEISNGKTDEEALLDSVEVTGPVIFLCGLVMAAAFGSMMISSMMELKEFGFVLSLAIILDSTLMVLVLIPAVMVVSKKYNWWMPFSGKKKE
jgi:putative drug exporter of the RND superfamily